MRRGRRSGTDTGALTAALAQVSDAAQYSGSSAEPAAGDEHLCSDAGGESEGAAEHAGFELTMRAVATDLKSAETQHTALISLIAALSKGSLFDYLK